jgi:hypothetical protein
MNPDCVRDLFSDRENRVQRRHGLLEYHRNIVAADGAHAFFRKRGDVLAFVQDFAADGSPGALGQKLDNGEGGDTFPAAGFTDQTHGLARFNAEGDSFDRADLAVAREERRLQIANFEQSGH